MIIYGTFSVTKSGTSYLIQHDEKRIEVLNSNASYLEVAAFYEFIRKQTPAHREEACADYLNSLSNNDKESLSKILGFEDSTEETTTVTLTEEELLERGLGNLLDFFKEFEFTPSFRFVNTLSRFISKGDNDTACAYILNYFSLMDSSYRNDIQHKMTSKEFKGVLKDIGAVAPTHTVNNRFKLYYGTQGTGKTTIAMKETDNRCIVCNSSMLPSDLMEDFVFVDGKATFKPSSLWRCMEEGKPIVLDEINLLPFDSLRFLQGVLDGKTEFEYKGQTVHVNEGFQIIGTMNLTVNGMTYGLPEPLIDRCSEIKEFKLTASMLKGAIM